MVLQIYHMGDNFGQIILWPIIYRLPSYCYVNENLTNHNFEGQKEIS